MAELYPFAEWLGNGLSGGEYFSSDGQLGPWRVVLHTTETVTVPNYNGGKTAPHLTYNPKTRQWLQHTKLTVASRALRNVIGGAQTNRERALQIELVCYSDKRVADASTLRLWVGDLPDTTYQDLRTFLTWATDQFGITPTWPGRQALSYAEANSPNFRMADREWDQFGGVCGHQHVPENTHWDPGAFQWNRLIGEPDMADPRITDEEAAFLTELRNATLSVNSNATFPQTIIPWYRENKNINARVTALENNPPTSGSGINFGDSVILQAIEQQP